MVHKVLLWTGFGLGVRLWQLGIEMRPLFNRSSLWVYPLYGGAGGLFGYWLMGVEERQVQILADRRDRLLDKRRRRAEREGDEETSIVESVKSMVGMGEASGADSTEGAPSHSGEAKQPAS